MEKNLFFTIISACCLVFLAACSGHTTPSPEPSITPAESVTVTKAELIDAIWNTEGDLSQNAQCLIGSTFKITKKTPFTIAKNTSPTDYNSGAVVIASSVNIIFDDASTDGRGAECGEGILNYSVAASADSPIDIESATAIKSRHSLIHMASGSNTSYPGCTIVAHFDKAGKAICGAPIIEEPEEVISEPDDTDEDSAADDTADDSNDTDDTDDNADDDDGIHFLPTPGFVEELKAQDLNDEGVPCGTEEIHSVKMVVDDYNCMLQDFTPFSKTVIK